MRWPLVLITLLPVSFSYAQAPQPADRDQMFNPYLGMICNTKELLKKVEAAKLFRAPLVLPGALAKHMNETVAELPPTEQSVILTTLDGEQILVLACSAKDSWETRYYMRDHKTECKHRIKHGETFVWNDQTQKCETVTPEPEPEPEPKPVKKKNTNAKKKPRNTDR